MTSTGEFERHDLEVDREMDVSIDGKSILVYFETRFDVEKKFNIDLGDEDGTWVNMYGIYNPFADTLAVHCVISRDVYTEESFDYIPSEEETVLMKQLIAEMVQKDSNLSPQDFCRECWPVIAQKDATSDNLLVYLTNCAGSENPNVAPAVRQQITAQELEWVHLHFREDYGCHCYGAIWCSRAGILLSREFYPEDCKVYLPDLTMPNMAALSDRMVEWAIELETLSELDINPFVLTDTDAATNGDPCHELCYFIPCSMEDNRVQEAVNCFVNWKAH